MQEKQRYEWLDLLKAIAILAVILNHTVGLVFNSQLILLHTGFSVTLFIFLAGITSSISISNRSTIDSKFLWSRISPILVSYIIASFIYHVYLNNMKFDFITFIIQIISFSASPPFYFFAFYLQLVLCSTFLYKVFKYKNSLIYHIFLLIIFYLISKSLTNNTVIGNIMGGGGKLLGGTYLFVFCLGIFFHIYLPKLTRMRVNVIGLPFFILLLIIFEKNSLIQLIWSNPPNNYLLVYTMIVFGLVFTFYHLLTLRFNYLMIIKAINYMGKYSLFIFMYHKMFIDLGSKYNLVQKIHIQNIYVNRSWIIFCSIFFPILLGIATKHFIKPHIKKLMFYST